MAFNGTTDNPIIRVLFLEDNREDARLAILTLARAGLSVDPCVVNTETEFKETFSSRPFDLVLCDFSLPGWNGLEALRWVRHWRVEMPFIYVSGTLGEEVAVECLKEGATDYVVKSRLDRLPRVVRRALEEGKVRTERDHALRGLRESESRFATAFRSTPEGITISRISDGRYIEANPAFLQTFGYEESQLIGKTALELGIWAEQNSREELMKKLEESEFVHGHSAKFRTRSGIVRSVEISAGQIQLQGQICLLAITRDVTELHSLQQQFLQAQKMEAVGRLAGGVAHDFNNLLMVIGGSAQLLDETTDPVKIKRCAAMIKDATDKAVGLTRQLLAFSRQQVLQPSVLDLNDVILGLWKMLPRLIGEDIHMERDLDHSLGRVSADRGQIEQILMNLVVNARDAMPDGGRVTVQTSNVNLDRAYAQRHGAAVPPGEYVMFGVSDSGCGMTDAVQERLFEPFFTTKEIGKGTGLGLATIYGIVKQSNGYIWAYSEVGKGSVFKIYLPRVEAAVKSQDVAKNALLPRGGSETILVVEDMVALRDFTVEYLRSCGYKVLLAKDGAEAIELIRGASIEIDLLLTDMVMPVLGGADLARQAKVLLPKLKVIFVSGYTDREVLRQPLMTNSVFLQKPFSMRDLAVKIRSLLDEPN